MSDPIRDLAERLARVERELHALATAPRAPFTSVQGGVTRWIDSGGAPVLEVGVQDDGSFVNISNPDHSDDGLKIIDGAWHAPLISAGWTKVEERALNANGDPTTSSGTYLEMWRTVIPITSGRLASSFAVIPAAGVTSMAMRIRAVGFPAASAPAVTLHEQTGITVSVNVAGPWDVPDTIHAPSRDPIGSLIQVIVQVRVTGGAGQVSIAPAYPLYNWV